MGRTVINETENKQTVILNDSPEGISGGYFDSQMNWNILDRPGIPYKKYKFKNNTTEETSGNKTFNCFGKIYNCSGIANGSDVCTINIISSGGGYRTMLVYTPSNHTGLNLTKDITNATTGVLNASFTEETYIEALLYESDMTLLSRILVEES